jgi:hypothetical protein
MALVAVLDEDGADFGFEVVFRGEDKKMTDKKMAEDEGADPVPDLFVCHIFVFDRFHWRVVNVIFPLRILAQ